MIRSSVLFLVIVIVGHANALPKRKFHDETSKPTNVDNLPRYPFQFFPREKWGGNPPTVPGIEQLGPVPAVIIHHTYEPGACHSEPQCSQAMRDILFMHQVGNGWDDIGYNFAVGGDGAVYEGRGWGVVGAHAAGFNINSTGIVLIGDWVDNVPPEHQLQVTRDLISVGVKLGFIQPDYTLIGHRDVGATECPGQKLYEEIISWDRFHVDAGN